MTSTNLLIILCVAIIVLLIIGYNSNEDNNFNRKKKTIEDKKKRKDDLNVIKSLTKEIAQKDEKSTQLIQEFLKRETASIIMSEEKNRFYESIMDHTSSPIYVQDMKRKFILINKAFAEMFKINKSDLDLQKYNNTNFLNRLLTDFDIHENLLSDAFVFDYKEPTSCLFQLTNGKVITIKKTYYQNSVMESFLIGIISDISELHKEKETVSHEKNMLEMILDSLPLPIFVTDENFIVLKVNKTLCELFGKEKSDFINTKYCCEDMFQCGQCNPCQIDEKQEFSEKIFLNGQLIEQKRYVIVIRKAFLLNENKHFVISMFDKKHEYGLFQNCGDSNHD